MIIRIPQWLRWLVDFEITFGKDLNTKSKAAKSYTYLKDIENELYEKKREIHQLKKIINAKTTTNKSNSTIKSKPVTRTNTKAKFQKESEELAKKTESILHRLQAEYYKYPFKDKYKSFISQNNGKFVKCVNYTFENGDTVNFVLFDADTQTNDFVFLMYFTSSTGEKINNKSHGPRLYSIVKTLLVMITNKSRDRHNPEPIRNESNTGDATKDRYNLIVRKIKLRQVELERTDKTASTYNALFNELNSYKRMADKLKKQLA